MTEDEGSKLDKIYTKLMLIEQGLNGVDGGPDGLYKKVTHIQKRQYKFEKYVYMFHGGLVMCGVIFSFGVTLYQMVIK